MIHAIDTNNDHMHRKIRRAARRIERNEEPSVVLCYDDEIFERNKNTYNPHSSTLIIPMSMLEETKKKYPHDAYIIDDIPRNEKIYLDYMHGRLCTIRAQHKKRHKVYSICSLLKSLS